MFFVFKQKTAYEMRISDWSSDVCSSDLLGVDVWEVIRLANRHPRVNILQPGPGVGGHCIAVDPWFIVHGDPENARLIRTAREVNDAKVDHVFENASRMIDGMPGAEIACLRSEEHTSELQSLMRISYAVFCLKKKKNKR